MADQRALIARFFRQYSEGEPEIILNRRSPRAVPSSDTSSGSLEVLARQAAACTACGLSSGRTNVVFGVGSPSARLMFVGEGPGADEDRQGEPFVGRAGQLLNKIIAAMKMTREEVYIANIVKCRPPDNRVPSALEAQACLHFLREQIRCVDPTLIVALGATAAQYLLEHQNPVTLKVLRGRIHRTQGKPVIVTYHPAALLRNAAYKSPTWEDMQTAMKIISGELKV